MISIMIYDHKNLQAVVQGIYIVKGILEHSCDSTMIREDKFNPVNGIQISCIGYSYVLYMRKATV